MDKTEKPTTPASGTAPLIQARPSPKPPRRSSQRLVYILAWASIFVVTWVAAGGYVIWRMFAKQLQDVQHQVQTDVTARVDSLAAQEQALANSLQNLRQTVENRDQDWLVAKAEYLMWIANERLALQRDVPTAITALVSADKRLASAADPSLAEVRKKLAQEIAALRNTAVPDITGIAYTLTSLEEQTALLPLLGTSMPTPGEEASTSTAEAKTVGQFFNMMWANLRSLVVIRRKAEGDPPLLSPDQRYFLQENLTLKLESARLALLRHDTKVFRDNLRSAQQWVERYFQPIATTKAYADTLAQLQTIELAPELPDVSGSLKMLQKWAAQQGPETQRKLGDEAQITRQGPAAP